MMLALTSMEWSRFPGLIGQKPSAEDASQSFLGGNEQGTKSGIQAAKICW